MSYYSVNTNAYYLKYSIYVDKVIFVHSFGTKDGHRNKGLSYEVFNKLKLYKLPILLECWPTLEKFYNKLGFTRECIGREGYLEMKYIPLKENNE